MYILVSFNLFWSYRNIPEYSDETEPAILTLLEALAGVEFGDFERFSKLNKYREILPKLKTLRISDLLLKVKIILIAIKNIHHPTCVFLSGKSFPMLFSIFQLLVISNIESKFLCRYMFILYYR